MDFEDIYDIYRIYSDGRIQNIKSNKFLKPRVGKNGYSGLVLQVYGKSKTFNVHRLVAIHFVKSDDPNKKFVCHLDGNKLNNDYSNLYWGTFSENMLDKRTHGTDPAVNKTHCPYEHPLEGLNLKTRILNGNLQRQCKACARARSRRFYEDKKQLSSRLVDLKDLADLYFELISNEEPTVNIEEKLKERGLI